MISLATARLPVTSQMYSASSRTAGVMIFFKAAVAIERAGPVAKTVEEGLPSAILQQGLPQALSHWEKSRLCQNCAGEVSVEFESEYANRGMRPTRSAFLQRQADTRHPKCS